MTGTQLHGLSSHDVELRCRQLSRDITRDGLGTCISGILAFKLPWLLLSGVYNITNFIHNIHMLRELKRAMRRAGIRVKKRIIAKGMFEGALTKLGSSIITFGHDDLADGAGIVASWLQHAGSYIAEHSSISLPTSWAFNPQPVVDWDCAHRMSHQTIKGTTTIAGWPTDKALELTQTERPKSPGWHENDRTLAKQALIVGSVQVANDKVVDFVLEKRYDEVKDSSAYYSWRKRVKAWFQR
ncbi:hypothetical protein Neosp_015105 [[Neocosmospora] mangrovei]